MQTKASEKSIQIHCSKSNKQTFHRVSTGREFSARYVWIGNSNTIHLTSSVLLRGFRCKRRHQFCIHPYISLISIQSNIHSLAFSNKRQKCVDRQSQQSILSLGYTYSLISIIDSSEMYEQRSSDFILTASAVGGVDCSPSRRYFPVPAALFGVVVKFLASCHLFLTPRQDSIHIPRLHRPVQSFGEFQGKRPTT